MVDTLPIWVPAPHSPYLHSLFYRPKYKACVLKMQLGITFLGDIVLWTGPHLGVTADTCISIWEGTWKHHPFCSWERWLADLGYVGARGLLVKYKGDDVNSAARLLFNNVHEHV